MIPAKQFPNKSYGSPRKNSGDDEDESDEKGASHEDEHTRKDDAM